MVVFTLVRLMTSENTKWEAGRDYECTSATSPAYKVGDVVRCYTNNAGWKCIRGRDGREDICTMLVSTFKRVGL